jgi:hypothetical protein
MAHEERHNMPSTTQEKERFRNLAAETSWNSPRAVTGNPPDGFFGKAL